MNAYALDPIHDLRLPMHKYMPWWARRVRNVARLQRLPASIRSDRTGDALSDIGDFLGDVGSAAVDSTLTVISGGLINPADKDWALKAAGDAGQFLVDHEPVLKTFQGIAQGKNLVDAIEDGAKAGIDTLKLVGPIVASIAPLIPGIGSAIGAAVGFAVALADGEPISDALIMAAASTVPGGAAAAIAFRAGATVAKDLVNGQPLDGALLDGARTAAVAAAQAVGVPPQVAGAAWDSAYALAQGKNLQDAGFAVAKQLLGGSQLGQNAVDFAHRITDAAIAGRSITSAVLQGAEGVLASYGPGIAQGVLKPAIDQVLANPDLAKLDPSQLASQLQLAPDLARRFPDLAQRIAAMAQQGAQQIKTAADPLEKIKQDAFALAAREAGSNFMHEQVVPIVNAMMKDNKLGALDPGALAAQFHVPVSVARVAKASVNVLPYGVIVPNRTYVDFIRYRVPVARVRPPTDTELKTFDLLTTSPQMQFVTYCHHPALATDRTIQQRCHDARRTLVTMGFAQRVPQGQAAPSPSLPFPALPGLPGIGQPTSSPSSGPAPTPVATGPRPGTVVPPVTTATPQQRIQSFCNHPAFLVDTAIQNQCSQAWHDFLRTPDANLAADTFGLYPEKSVDTVAHTIVAAAAQGDAKARSAIATILAQSARGNPLARPFADALGAAQRDFTEEIYIARYTT